MEAESDPQCLKMLETLLNVEIEVAEKTLSSLEEQTKTAKTTAHTYWKERKQLQEKIRISKENVKVFTIGLNQQNKYNTELSNKIQMVNLNMDDQFKARQAESQKYEDILKQYENMREDYRAKYEEFPLANARRDAEMRLKKIQVEKMMVDYKIKELKNMSRQKENIAWMTLRGRIVKFARDMLNIGALDRELTNLNETIKKRREELKAVDEEIAVQLKAQEEKKRIRELEMLKMPPPKINMSYMKSRFRASTREDWKINCEDSLDSISVDTLLEEMCLSDETSLREPHGRSSFLEDDKNLEEEVVDTGNPYPDQDEEMEQEDAGPEPIDTPDEEPGRQLDSKEHPARDKQTSDLEEEEDIPPKRIKLMSDEPRTWNSPAATLKPPGQLPRKSQQLDLSRGPRITKIETVRCDLFQKLHRDELNRSTMTQSGYPIKAVESFSSNTTVRLKEARLDLSPESRISKTEAYEMTPISRCDQVNPASMFSPGYSENSLSFCADKNFENLKDDQISLFGGSTRGSTRGFNPCSPRPSSSKQQPLPVAKNFSQISFSNLLKGSSKKGSNKLF